MTGNFESVHALDEKRNWRLGELLDGYVDVASDQDRPVGKLALNSRDVESGDVFFAMPGSQADGRDYIDMALERKAAAIVYEKAGAGLETDQVDNVPLLAVHGLREVLGPIASRYYGFPSNRLRVLGVTGTNGKTTVAYLIAQALDYLDTPCAYFGSIGTGQVGDLQHSELTTLDSIQLHGSIAEAVRSEFLALAMEVSSHGLDQGRVNGVEFDVGIFTNLTRDHLDYHGTFEKYGLAKRKLFEFPGMLVMVINTDDAFGREMAEFCRTETAADCLTYGINQGADICPKNIEFGPRRTAFELNLEGQCRSMESTLIGRINLSNILATVGALQSLQMRPEDIVEAIRHVSAPPGRMELLRGSCRLPGVVVDYAHTPDALENALCSLRELCSGKLIAVFGCGGERDTGKRPLMGAIAERYADKVILTSDNPRREPPEQILEAIKSGMQSSPEVCPDRGEAIRLAIEQSAQDDLILVAGKGHERYQMTNEGVLNFSDSRRVKELLEAVS